MKLHNYTKQLEDERKIAKTLILNALKEKPLSVSDLTELLRNNQILFCNRLAKEIAWDMAETQTAVFNNAWLLEIGTLQAN